MDTYTVAVRVPVGFEAVGVMAGWLQSGVADYMKACGYAGTPYVLFRDEAGRLCGFRDGEGLSFPEDKGDVLGQPELVHGT
jgi:hypothetical protein